MKNLRESIVNSDEYKEMPPEAQDALLKQIEEINFLHVTEYEEAHKWVTDVLKQAGLNVSEIKDSPEIISALIGGTSVTWILFEKLIEAMAKAFEDDDMAAVQYVLNRATLIQSILVDIMGLREGNDEADSDQFHIKAIEMEMRDR